MMQFVDEESCQLDESLLQATLPNGSLKFTRHLLASSSGTSFGPSNASFTSESASVPRGGPQEATTTHDAASTSKTRASSESTRRSRSRKQIVQPKCFAPLTCVYVGFTRTHFRNLHAQLLKNFFMMYSPLGNEDAFTLNVLVVIDYTKGMCIEINQRLFGDFICTLAVQMLDARLVPFAIEVKDAPANRSAEMRRTIHVRRADFKQITNRMVHTFKDREEAADEHAVPTHQEPAANVDEEEVSVQMTMRRGYLIIKFDTASTLLLAGRKSVLPKQFNVRRERHQSVQTEESSVVPLHYVDDEQREQMRQVAGMQEQLQKLSSCQYQHMHRVGLMQLLQMRHFTQVAQQVRKMVELAERVMQRSIRFLPSISTSKAKNPTVAPAETIEVVVGVSREVQTDGFIPHQLIDHVDLPAVNQFFDTINETLTVNDLQQKLEHERRENERKNQEIARLNKEKDDLEALVRRLRRLDCDKRRHDNDEANNLVEESEQPDKKKKLVAPKEMSTCDANLVKPAIDVRYGDDGELTTTTSSELQSASTTSLNRNINKDSAVEEVDETPQIVLNGDDMPSVDEFLNCSDEDFFNFFSLAGITDDFSIDMSALCDTQADTDADGSTVDKTETDTKMEIG